MKLLEKLRAARARRRANDIAGEPARREGRREVEAADRSLAQATHPPPPNVTGYPGGF